MKQKIILDITKQSRSINQELHDQLNNESN